MRRILALGALLAVALAPSALAHAGGFGGPVETRFQMPPWVLWSVGAGVVAVSFAVVGVFLTRRTIGVDASATWRDDAQLRVDAGPHWGAVLLLALLMVAVANAVVGGDGAFPQALVWMLLWVLLPTVAYLVADPWPALNPFRLFKRGTPEPPRAWPVGLGSWLAVAFLLALILLEVVDTVGHEPRTLAALILLYGAATLAGMRAFGRHAWLARGDVFTRMYHTWASMGPAWRWGRGGERAPLARDLSDVAFVVALLYGVNFDGFLATPLGADALAALAPLGGLGSHAVVLLVGYALFLGAFLLCARGIRWYAGSLAPTATVAARFAPALVPIAVGYHLAHNLPYLLVESPRLLVAVGDPLGLGWAPFGAPELALPTAAGAWIASFQMLCIVGAHVLAVVVAHRLAFEAFASRVQAIRSELPLTLVMVLYTFVGLWLVSGAYVAPTLGGGA